MSDLFDISKNHQTSVFRIIWISINQTMVNWSSSVINFTFSSLKECFDNIIGNLTEAENFAIEKYDATYKMETFNKDEFDYINLKPHHDMSIELTRICMVQDKQVISRFSFHLSKKMIKIRTYSNNF